MTTVHQKAGFLRDAVFSANDGIVTTFAVVAGAGGASLGASVILILGFANLFADGISMAVGNYLGVKSEMEFEESKGDGGWRREGSPVTHAVVTFIAFDLAGLIPLVPFLLKLESAFQLSTILVGFSFFGVGILRSIYTKKNLFKSAVEVFLVGGLASFVAFAVGFFIDRYIV